MTAQVALQSTSVEATNIIRSRQKTLSATIERRNRLGLPSIETENEYQRNAERLFGIMHVISSGTMYTPLVDLWRKV